MDLQKFYQGNEFNAYEYLGAQYKKQETTFRVYAPEAKAVSVMIEGQEYPMTPVQDGRFYECSIKKLAEGTCYEYRIYEKHGWYRDHSDPYGFGMELRPDHKSIVRNLGEYQFKDQAWMKRRKKKEVKPMNIYEVHLGSFKKPGTLSYDWYNYEEIADLLIPYVKESGYNYVEIMPLGEYPCDESWGYQTTGFFSPTSRYGTASQLKKLVDRFHRNQIGVILDFVPVHFAVDEYALRQFDGVPLYEYPYPDVAYSEWGSCNFFLARGEVQSFLKSAANYWMQEFHFDGLRMDAVSRILYWMGDESRGVNQPAVDFLKTMNAGLKKKHPDAILIAEDSSTYPYMTKPVSQGGVGFDYKWNMGWMHDTLDYFRMHPYNRKANYHKLTFSMLYSFSEDFVLPFSHDEVVYGKAAILQKMYGEYEDKFSQARALYLYMMMHPGKKLNFMGNEIGQFREWDEKREQDWELRAFPAHDAFYHFMKDLNHMYLTSPAMYEIDDSFQGFQWLDCHQEELSIYAIQRMGKKEVMAGVWNLSDQPRKYQIPFEDDAKYRMVLHTDWECYGGKMKKKKQEITKEDTILIPPYSGILYEKRR